MRCRCSSCIASSRDTDLLHGDQVLGGHQLTHRTRARRDEADVTIGENADQTLRRGLDHRQPGDAVATHQLQRLVEPGLRHHGHRVDDDARLELLDLPHLRGLLVERQVLVDDAEPALLRHGDGHRRLGDGVHRRRDHRNLQVDVGRHPGAHVDRGRQHLGIGGLQQHVIEGERVADRAVGRQRHGLIPRTRARLAGHGDGGRQVQARHRRGGALGPAPAHRPPRHGAENGARLARTRALHGI